MSKRNAVARCGIAAMLLLRLASPCMAKEPHSAEDYFKRGLSRYAARDLDGAIGDFTTAIMLNSRIDTGALKRLVRIESTLDSQGRSGLTDNVAVMDRFNALAYYNRGNARMDKGDLNGAIRDFDKAVTLNPHNILAWNNRGVARQKTGDLEGALGDFNRTIQLAQRSSRAYNNRGTLRIEMKDSSGAIADYTRAIEIDPRNAAAFNNRGNAYDAQGELDRACRDFDRAIELDGNMLDAYMNRGLTLIRQGKEAEAEKDFAHYLRFMRDKKDALSKLVREARDSRQREK